MVNYEKSIMCLNWTKEGEKIKLATYMMGVKVTENLVLASYFFQEKEEVAILIYTREGVI